MKNYHLPHINAVPALTILCSLLVGLTGITFLLNGLSVRAAAVATGEPQFITLAIEASLPFYDPNASTPTNHTVYFNNSTEGVITTTVAVTGSSPLTLTISPAFGQMTSTQVFTPSPALSTTVYTITPAALSQVMAYTAQNISGTTLVEITYTQDITPPATTLWQPEGGLWITTSYTSPHLVLSGTAVDVGAGVQSVLVNGEPASATDTIWAYTWTVPLTSSQVYTFSFYGVDNVENMESPHIYTVTVDNLVLLPPTFTVAVEGNNLRFLWGAPTGAVESYDLEVYQEGVSSTLVYTTTLDATQREFFYLAACGAAYSGRLRFHRPNGTTSEWVASGSTDTVKCYLYLPTMIRPLAPLVATGDILFSAPRQMGITTFDDRMTLDFSGIQFLPPPTQMRIWFNAETEPSTWITYTPTITETFIPSGNGLQMAHVRFGAEGTALPSDVKTMSFFHINNGDFDEPGDMMFWDLSGGSLGYSFETSKLRLGSINHACDNVPLGESTAQFTLVNLPSNSNYILHVQATVHTYDQIPDLTQSVYDAFEIHIGNDVSRYGNVNGLPLNCNTLRDVSVEGVFPMSGYTGSVLISLENLSRFDKFYNTYTDIETVWVEVVE